MCQAWTSTVHTLYDFVFTSALKFLDYLQSADENVEAQSL